MTHLNGPLSYSLYLLVLALFIVALAYDHGMVTAGVVAPYVSDVLAPALGYGALIPFLASLLLAVSGFIDLVRGAVSAVSASASIITLVVTILMFGLFAYYSWNFYVV